MKLSGYCLVSQIIKQLIVRSEWSKTNRPYSCIKRFTFRCLNPHSCKPSSKETVQLPSEIFSMAHQSDTTSYTTVSDSHSTESGNPNREEVGVNAATPSHARRPKETVSRNSSAIALDKPSKEGSRYVHNAIASIVTKILSGDQNVPGVSVPLSTIIPDDGACREITVVLRENVSGLPEEGPKNDKHVSKVRGEKVNVTQVVEANPRADTVNLEEFSDNEPLASVIPSIAKRVRTRREKKTVV